MKISMLWHTLFHPKADTPALADNWISEFLDSKEVKRWAGTVRNTPVVHPCTIGTDRVLIYEQGLDQNDPKAYALLVKLGKNNGITILEDRRANRRPNHRWTPIIALAGIMVFETAAADGLSSDNVANFKISDNYLALIDSSVGRNSIYGEDHISIDGNNYSALKSATKNSDASTGNSFIYQELKKHYITSANDPAKMHSELKLMATYYSQFPKVVSLFRALSSTNWKLQYKASTFVTHAKSNRFKVHSATVMFDPNSAAQFRMHPKCLGNPLCTASSADLLLHEILHVKTMLLETEKFIEQGGANSIIYPIAHEDYVISLENALYKYMSNIDGKDRPHRNSHAGKLVLASCALCIK